MAGKKCGATPPPPPPPPPGIAGPVICGNSHPLCVYNEGGKYNFCSVPQTVAYFFSAASKYIRRCYRKSVPCIKRGIFELVAARLMYENV